MPNDRPETSAAPHTCLLTNYGISQQTVDSVISDMVGWMSGDNLTWTQTRYISHYIGPGNNPVVELLFFHYDGIAGRELGQGGENNYAKLYLYREHCTLSFNGDDGENCCALRFKYSTKWQETSPVLCDFLFRYLNQHLFKVFANEPRRFNGSDSEIEVIKVMVELLGRMVQMHPETEEHAA